MPRSRFLLVLSTFLFLVAARHRAVQHPAGWPLTAPPQDVFTFANAAEVSTRHLALDLTVDFESRQLRGQATLYLDNHTGTRQLVLDTDGIDVRRVTLDGASAQTQWSLGARVEPKGEPLTIAIEPTTTFVTIEYETSSSAEGLLWNTAEQSFGRQQPYLYTQNEPIAARSWIPIQDTPSMRLTYEAVIHAPRGLLALMSCGNNPTQTNDTGVYRFDMRYPIPPYLVALAVGRLQFAQLDERTGVYAEPELLPDAEWELQYIPAMVDAGERIAGLYPFARYDVLLMPPTYVAGGMEHPMLNFISPMSVVTGNRPARLNPTSLIAHELSHSWAGDSTTLATWDDIWLNEGITSYLALRILEEVDSAERAEYGFFNDRRNYSAYAANAPQFATILHHRYAHPGSGFGATNYTKGELFAKTLEDEIGRERFDLFLRRYFQTFAFRWVDDLTFLEFLRETVIGDDAALEQRLKLDAWVYGPGLPANLTAPVTSAIHARALERATRFATGVPITELDPASWTDVEIDAFIGLAAGTVLHQRMAEVDAALALSTRNTPPLSWLLHSIQARYEPGIAGVERALMRGGPNSWIATLYSALNEIEGGHDRAIAIFQLARKRYLESIEAQVASLLGISSLKAIREAA